MPATGEGMTGSLNPGLPTAGHTGTDERTAPSPANPGETDSDLLRRPHRPPNGAGLKALRPLTRSRSARAPTPTPTSARLHGRDEAQTPVTDTLDFQCSLRNDPQG
jgi:hypothetical protein